MSSLLLFIIYINDLPKVVLDFNISMYSNDTSLYYQLLYVHKLNEVLEELQKWLMGNELSRNAMKT